MAIDDNNPAYQTCVTVELLWMSNVDSKRGPAQRILISSPEGIVLPDQVFPRPQDLNHFDHFSASSALYYFSQSITTKAYVRWISSSA